MLYRVTLPREDILFFCSLFEVSERYASIRTVDRERPLLEIAVSPYLQKEFEEYFALVRTSVPVEVLEVIDDEPQP